MSILIFLRQYGLREYAITLSVAAIVGLGIAVLINAAAGGSAGAPTVLKTKEQLTGSSRVLPARVDKPFLRKAHPAVKQQHVRRRAVHKVRRAPRPAAGPAQPLVATRTPEPQSPTPKPKPAPVVQTPAPAPNPAPTRRTGGGRGQFDDSG